MVIKKDTGAMDIILAVIPFLSALQPSRTFRLLDATNCVVQSNTIPSSRRSCLAVDHMLMFCAAPDDRSTCAGALGCAEVVLDEEAAVAAIERGFV